MENFKDIWLDLRRRAIAQLICIIVSYCYIKMLRKREINYNMSSKRGRVREEIMGHHTDRNIVKMGLKDTEFQVIKGAISEVAAAVREGNAILRKNYSHKLPPISGEETWNLVKECGCDINLLPKIYCFLMNDIDKLRTVLQCPAEARRAVIMQMVFGSSNPPS